MSASAQAQPREMKDSGVEWIGMIPKEWKVSKIKFYTNCFDGRRVPLEASFRKSGKYPYWGAGNIVDYIDEYLFDEELILLGEDGAPFFDKTRPVAFLSNGKIWVNNHIHVLKACTGMSARFVTYYLNAVDYGSYINGSILNKLTQTNMNRIALLLPTFEEQQRIADYLDRKCGKIDDTIAKQKQLIEKLKAYKLAVITEAVTKGLDPNVEMKDSGVEWIGMIPKEWVAIKLKYLLSVKSGDVFDKNQLCDHGQFPVYGGGNIIGYTDKYNVSPDKILIGRVGARCGCITLVKQNSWATDNALIVSSEINTYYLMYILITAQLNKLNFSNAQPLLTGGNIKDYFVPFTANLQKQQRIVSYLDRKCSAIDNTISTAEALIGKLTDYKKSLIYELVTGKRSV